MEQVSSADRPVGVGHGGSSAHADESTNASSQPGSYNPYRADNPTNSLLGAGKQSLFSRRVSNFPHCTTALRTGIISTSTAENSIILERTLTIAQYYLKLHVKQMNYYINESVPSTGTEKWWLQSVWNFRMPDSTSMCSMYRLWSDRIQ